MPENPFILKLRELGQSVWYDNCSRDVLQSGELASLIEAGVSGLTSNPTIFKKAIADTSNYDLDIRELLREGLDSAAICEELMVADVGAAADLLLPVFEQTGGADGYASIEVSPFLAKDTQGTIEAAQRLWQKLNRPNIMIKIPATAEGLPAIRQVISAGMNVNVTLIFSDEVYRQVVDAFLSGIEDRQSRGDGVANIASVASFFVSRVDSICEKQLEAKKSAGNLDEAQMASVLGKIGVANSKVAYESFKELFSDERFKKLQKVEPKLRVQRPLWASTGTKNPQYSEVLYVEELAGKDTVNTLPPHTLAKLMESAVIEPKLHQGLDDAKQVLSRVNSYGLDFSALLGTLQVDGVQAFADSYQQLLDATERKCDQVGG